MNKKQPAPRPELSEQEKRESFLVRRMRAFEDRSREPGDGATWAVVLGAFMFTLLIICLSVAEQAFFAFIVFVIALVWVAIMGQFGKVNVASVLWGSATTDADKPPVDAVVFRSTLAVALISLIAMIVDVINGWGFGWYGVVLAVSIAVYLGVYIQARLQPTRSSNTDSV